MDITGEHRIDASRERVWAALNDPEVLRACIPGCEHMERVSATEVNARVIAKVGPVRAAFDTRLLLTNLNPPVSYTLIGESKGGAAGFGRGTAEVSLHDDGDGTLLRYKADFQVGGKLAQVGARLVSGVTRKTADDFFSAFSSHMNAGEVAVDAAPEAVALARPVSRRYVYAGAAALLVAGVLLWLAMR